MLETPFAALVKLDVILLVGKEAKEQLEKKKSTALTEIFSRMLVLPASGYEFVWFYGFAAFVLSGLPMEYVTF